MSHLVIIYLVSTIANLIVLGTTAYAVFWLGYSGWWFLLALMIMGGSEVSSKNKSND